MILKKCKWCGKWILPFSKEVEGMHPRCERAYQAWMREEVSVRCWNGHTFTIPRKEMFEKCPVCGEQVNPTWWYESTRACVNVMTMLSEETAKAADGQEVEVEVERGKPPCRFVMKQIPYLPDAVQLVPVEEE